MHDRRDAWDQWYRPVAHARTITALWHTLAWAIFGGAYVGAIVYVAVGLDANVGDVVLVVTAGSRLSQYVGAAVGELGFLRGIWLDSSRRLAWLEDYAASKARTAEVDGARPTSRTASRSSTCRSRTRAPTTTRSPT